MNHGEGEGSREEEMWARERHGPALQMGPSPPCRTPSPSGRRDPDGVEACAACPLRSGL